MKLFVAALSALLILQVSGIAAECETREAAASAIDKLRAPLKDGFNDPNLIRYDATLDEALDCLLRRDRVVNPMNEHWPAIASIELAPNVARNIRYQQWPALMGDKFRGADLVRYLNRRADGDPVLHQDTLQIIPIDVCTVIELAGRSRLFDSAPAMLKLLNDPNDSVRAAAASYLGVVGHDRADVFDALSKKLESDQYVYQIAPTMYLFGPKAMPVMLKALARRPNKILIESFGSFHSDANAAVPALIPFLLDINNDEAAMAASALGQIGPAAEPAIPQLISMSQNPHMRRRAYYAMAAMSPKARDIMLKEARANGDYSDAIMALSSAEPFKDAHPIIVQAMEDPNKDVRTSAIMALRFPVSQAAIPALIKRLADVDPDVRVAALQQLSGYDRHADVILPAMKAVLANDPVESVRDAARDAIDTLKVEQEPKDVKIPRAK